MYLWGNIHAFVLNMYQAQQWSITNILQLKKHLWLTQGNYCQELRKH